MEDFPAWVREGMRDEGWVVVESLETFDVHSGDRYADRAIALRKALAGDALLASSGQATLSRDVEGAFFIGRLWRSSKPLPSGERVTLVYSLDSVERHVKISPAEAPQPAAVGVGRTRPWTCPACNRTWALLEEEPEVPEAAVRCPDCGEPPTGFSAGQVVHVEQGGAQRLGVVDEPVQAVCVSGEGVEAEAGPYTGEFMVWRLSEGYGSSAPVSPEFERDVFSSLPRDPERRRRLAAHFMTGISAGPEQLQALDADEERALLGAPSAE